MTKLTLTATVTARPNEGKVKVLTDVLIRVGNKALAFKTLGGKYTAHQALTEFKRAPNGWQPQPGQDAASVAFYAASA
jgi:hypothetical protein